MEKNLEVVEVMRRHGRAMDPDFIAEDYADDAVVICNMINKPAVGKAEIRDMIDIILHSELMQKAAAHPEELTGDDEATDTSHGEYCLHIFKNTSMGMSGVETYQVRDNKIVFESATVQAL